MFWDIQRDLKYYKISKRYLKTSKNALKYLDDWISSESKISEIFEDIFRDIWSVQVLRWLYLRCPGTKQLKRAKWPLLLADCCGSKVFKRTWTYKNNYIIYIMTIKVNYIILHVRVFQGTWSQPSFFKAHSHSPLIVSNRGQHAP